MSEPLGRLLADLPPADPDAARAERTRMRCRSRLASLPRVSVTSASSPRSRRVLLWQPLLAVLGVAYVAEAIVHALRAYASP